MAIFLLDMWMSLKGKRKENYEVVEKILQFGEKHPKISKHVKSVRYFKQGIGGKSAGARVLIRVRESYRNGQILSQTAKEQRLAKNSAEMVRSDGPPFSTYLAY